ncbi:MAG: hypothetical protein P9L99_05665 [Candidatus Lernaella stagnicola]|nr:hypothetical protein [Candidatus Lernaella stagnicola]
MTGEVVYVVCGCKPWSRSVFDEHLATLPGRWRYVATKDELTAARLAEWSPRFVFFLHWSWKIPAAIHERHTCIGFHMTDLPFGRGGSPLQNLIVRGATETTLTAFGIEADMDTGAIYDKRPLSLAGTAQEIYERASRLAAQMIADLIAQDDPQTRPQTGEPTMFARRTPAQSEIPDGLDLARLYDHLRMLDAETYPRAFLKHGGFRFEFSAPRLESGRLVANVTISRETEN